MANRKKRPKVKQNTPEWLALRKEMIGASDAPVIMEESPFSTPYERWQEKMGLIETEVNASMLEGQRLEPMIRKMCEEKLLCSLEPKVIFHPHNDFMMASMDALDDQAGIAVEIKMARREDHDLVKAGAIPLKYKGQVQHQLACLWALYEVDEMWYASYSKADDDLQLVKVQIDVDYIATMMNREKEFYKCMHTFTAPPLTDRDYRVHDDKEWLDMVRRWDEINEIIEPLAKEKDAIKAMFIQRADGHNCKGGGVRLTKVNRRGTVDYSAIPELKKVKLDKYRKANSEYWKLTRRKDDS